ncbi:MAG: non-lysosomal glucosylceramidase [Opitutales bacterium]|jgi:non-lysosomal glucosylceramidase|nr:non-lysosomal glucosylceramidase [Opitutales bacterium]
MRTNSTSTHDYGHLKLGRRDFLRAGGLTAAMLMASRINVMAGPFSAADFDKIIPADKKLSADWIKSLYARGQALTATGADLKYIGMPINGICTGQVYLGGDGQLWHWNLDGAFDAKNTGKGPRYLKPDVAHSPMSQGFALQVSGKTYTLDSKGFSNVTFTNQYPMATVDYSDSTCPVDVQLQAYTPFIPLNRDDSSYPVIVMRYKVSNSSSTDQEVDVAGWIENISNAKSRKGATDNKLAAYRQLEGISSVECSTSFGDGRSDADVEVFADFEGNNYKGWKVEGAAFGKRPSGKSGGQKLTGVRGKSVANSYARSDKPTGKLTSPTFNINKPYINFLMGGGNDKEALTVSLWIDGKLVRSTTGKDSDNMEWATWDVESFTGKKAHIEINDQASGGWGHIEVDQIEFSSHPGGSNESSKLKLAADYGAIALGLLGDESPTMVDLARSVPGHADIFQSGDVPESGASHSRAMNEPAYASLGSKLALKPGESKTVAFTLSWRFPNVVYSKRFGRIPGSLAKNHYATLWPTAASAAATVAQKETELHRATQTWVDTWYDSTLPHWFLERTFLTLDCVQTQMGQRLAVGEGDNFYDFDEGVKCCPGNCTHVWHYAQGLARIFPEIERECRDKVEYDRGFDPQNGSIRHRHFADRFGDAIDGNCGTILRVLRESQMTTDYSFLESIWDRVKLSMDHVIQKWDRDEDGMLAGAQHNTLDEPWYGQVHWLINLYHASLKASAVMARQMKQPAVAERYEGIVKKGAPAMVDLLWNEEFGYFIHKAPDDETQMHGSTNGCHIDQILGDSWLPNVGIDPILPKDKIKKSLQALWKYNFTPDVGAFRKAMTNGRWYAAAGDAGLVMCSFPNGKIEPKSGKPSYAGYLNECMTGFEWQVAAHMIWEGMLEEGLAIGKAIYDRYTPDKRNPYNEIECSDHYSRAMASYGAYIAACGYRYDGPEGKLAFGPRITPDDFRAAFTAAEGWGRFTQKVASGQHVAGIQLGYGRLQLKEFSLDKVSGVSASGAKVELDGKPVSAVFISDANAYTLKFNTDLMINSGQRLQVILS